MSVRGNNLDTVRRHNLSTILSMVHHDGAVSRSQLTRATGLNRSTVAALVTELVELRLVVETESEAARTVGRPSPVVRPHPGAVAIAVNPEVDALTVGLVGLNARVISQVRHEVEHPMSAEETVQATTELIEPLIAALPSDSQVIGIGVAVPGLVRASDGLVRVAPHLGWVDAPITEMITEATGLPAVADNDASLGALAERLFGAGRGVDDLVYLNGGASGIGGGVVVNGMPLKGVGGYAGEFGHNLVTAPDGPDAATTGGVLEDEVNRAKLLELLGMSAADPEHLESAMLESSDPALAAEVERQCGILSVALRNAVNVLNPELIVLGGFLAALFAVDPDRFARLVSGQTFDASFEGVSIARAALGDEILLIGAAELAFTALLADPAGSLLAAGE